MEKRMTTRRYIATVDCRRRSGRRYWGVNYGTSHSGGRLTTRAATRTIHATELRGTRGMAEVAQTAPVATPTMSNSPSTVLAYLRSHACYVSTQYWQ